MPGLRRDHDARASLRDHLAEFFQHERDAVEIHFEDRLRRGLGRRNASGVNEPVNIADRNGLFDESVERGAGGNFDRRRCGVESGFAQRLRGRRGVLRAQIGDQ